MTFPTVNPGELKLLDWYAGCALMALVVNSQAWEIDEPHHAAQDAFAMAREMLKAREKHVPREEIEP